MLDFLTPGTGYLIFFLFLIPVACANLFVFLQTRRQLLFRWWSLGFLYWVLTIGSVLLQPYSDIIGVIGTSVFMPLFLIYSLKATGAVKRFGQIPVLVPVTAVTAYAVLQLLLYIPKNHIVWRSFISGITTGLVFSFIAIWHLLYARRHSTSRHTVHWAEIATYYIVAIASLVFASAWFVRAALALSFGLSGSMYAPSLTNVISIVIIPPVTILINFAMIQLSLQRERVIAHSLRGSLLVSENDAVTSKFLSDSFMQTDQLINRAYSQVDRPPEELDLAALEDDLEECTRTIVDRNTVLNLRITQAEVVEIASFIQLVNRLLAQSEATRDIGFHPESSYRLFRIPQKILFITLYTLASWVRGKTPLDEKKKVPKLIIPLCVAPGDPDPKKSVVVTIDAPIDVLHPEETSLSGESIEWSLEENVHHRSMRLLWLARFLDDGFHGTFTVERIEDSGRNRFTFGFEGAVD